TLEVIDESPSFLKEVKGIGPARIARIRDSWREQKAVRRIIVFLQSHGLGTARAVRIYKTYGDQAIEVVRENPYRLATDIWGVGFQTADQLALRMGMDRNSPQRAQAAVRYVLTEFSEKGHVGYPEEGVIAEAQQATQIGREIIEQAIEQGRAQEEIVRDSPALIAKSTDPFSGKPKAPASGESETGAGSRESGAFGLPLNGSDVTPSDE